MDMQRFAPNDTARHDGTRGYFAIGEREENRAWWRISTVTTEGDELFAIRWLYDRTECQLARYSYVGDRQVEAVHFFVDDQPWRMAILSFDVSRAGPLDVRPLAQEAFPWPDNWSQRFAANEMLIAMELIPVARIGVVRGDGSLQTFEPFGPGAQMYQPVPVGANVLYREYTPRRLSIGVIHSDGTVEPYVAGLSYDALLHDSDGEHVAWLQAYDKEPVGGFYGRIELWGGVYAADPSLLTPSRLHMFGRGVPLLVHNIRVQSGWVAVADPTANGEEILLYRFSDAQVRRLTAPAGLVFYGVPMYISDDEVLVVVGHPNLARATTVFRIQLEAVPVE